MSKFQLILTIVFGIFIVMGVLVFSFVRTSSVPPSYVTIWGTIPQEIFNEVLSQSPLGKSKILILTYVQKNSDTFDQDFVEALASGTGPDVVLLPHEEILKNQSKLFTIPYTSYPERTFKDNFIQEGELFLSSKGVLALPLTVDPLVMYWNRDIFNNANLPTPPTYWDEFYGLAQKLTTKDGALNITRSAVALGGWRNVTNAKALVSTLLLQAGDPIVKNNGTKNDVVLGDSVQNLPISPAVAALTFYTEFSNPAKPFYSWNPALPESQNMFISGDLATYFGFASEISSLKLKNPNLNFDVTQMPQSRNSGDKITFGELQAFAIVKTSKTIGGSFGAITSLTSPDNVALFARALHLPPASRLLLASVPKDPYLTIFYQSSLWSMGWFDPNAPYTERSLQIMIENITGGKARLEVAISKARDEIKAMLNN